MYDIQQIDPDDPVLSDWGETVASSNIERQWGLQLSWTPCDELQVKQSLLSIDNWHNEFAPADPSLPDALVSDESPLYHELVTSVEYTRHPIQITAECLYWDAKGTTTYTAGEGKWSQTGIGGYLSTSWEFLPSWRVGALVQAHNLSYKDAWWGDSSDQTRSAGFSTSYAITEHWLIKAEAQRVKGTYFLRAEDQPTPGEFDAEYWNLFALKTTFDF